MVVGKFLGPSSMGNADDGGICRSAAEYPCWHPAPNTARTPDSDGEAHLFRSFVRISELNAKNQSWIFPKKYLKVLKMLKAS